MILRRVIAHFRQQEWTAIATDFVIVVVGVFIGIQMANWNATRAERLRIADLGTRLHDVTVNKRGIVQVLQAVSEDTP